MISAENIAVGALGRLSEQLVEADHLAGRHDGRIEGALPSAWHA